MLSRYSLCSSMPVATAKIFGSKMMSSGGNPTCSVRSWVRSTTNLHFRLYVSACPSSSNAMTITAAPYRRICRAFAKKSSSPSFKLIEFDDPFSLNARQTCFYNLPSAGVQHNGYATNIGFRCNEVEKLNDCGFGI